MENKLDSARGEDHEAAAVEAVKRRPFVCRDCGTTLEGPNVLHTWQDCRIVRLTAELAEARASLERAENELAIYRNLAVPRSEFDEARAELERVTEDSTIALEVQIQRAEKAERELAEAQEQLDYARTRWVPRSDLARAEEEN